MLVVQMEGSCGPNGRGLPGILDSPTLARVERAMLRQEEETTRGPLLRRAAFTKSLLPTNYGSESVHAIKKGLLWQHRAKLFSRWKERYFILTDDYLHCFRRASGSDRISEMGQFLFKIKLVDVDRVEWENKKTYSTVVLILTREGKIYLRAAEGLEDWFELLEECTRSSKEKRRALRISHDGKRDNNNIMKCFDDWRLETQHMNSRQLQQTETVRRHEGVKRREWHTREEDEWENPSLDNRLSLLTDIDISSYDEDTSGATSIASYRMNPDVVFIQSPQMKASGSFRSSRNTNMGTIKRAPPNLPENQLNPQPMKFRERSYSDIQRVDRRLWRPLDTAYN